MENDRHVRKHNLFVDGRYRFGVNEQKVLMTVISKIRIEDKDFVPYRVSWSDIKSISRDRLNTTKKIDDACQSLKNKTIKLKKGRVQDNFGFLSGWKVSPGAWVEFRIDPTMKDMLLQLLEDGNFTLYRLECVLSLNSSYSIRLYEILKSHQWKSGWIKIDLKQIKWSLGVPETVAYEKFGLFKAQILEKAKKDLQRHTDIKFEYQTVKEGRKVVALKFKISENKRYQKTVSSEISKRNHAKDGDTVVIAGKEYIVEGDCVRDPAGAPIPIGKINRMIKEGVALIK